MRAIHLINDEKFLPKFMERAATILGHQEYVVFGAQEPFRFLPEGTNVKSTERWTPNDVDSISDVFVHFMTYSKIKWIKKHAPKARVHWIYFGSDLYELLMVFHGFNLYANSEQQRGFLSNVKGRTMKDKIRRFAELKVYHRTFKRFVAERLTTFRFWNPGDFELLCANFPNNATFTFFQYGAYDRSDIEFSLELQKPPREGQIKVLVNHSGTQSGNHHFLIDQLCGTSESAKLEIHAPLSYGDNDHIASTDQYGHKTLGKHWHSYLDFIPRMDYYRLLAQMDIACFGHRRQEAGNSLFISLLMGTKVFIHPESVLLPYLKQEGFYFYTYDDIGTPGWEEPLSEAEVVVNKKAALNYFSESRIEKAYQLLNS
ncbi:MAG: hypothetical protein RL754_1428 [Bacteroidota bacterium]|jgi:hypothetical protein